MSASAPAGGLRLLGGIRRDGRMTTLDEHLERYGRASVTPAFLEELEASGLQGRGGAGFPSAVKMRAVAEQGGRPVVVVNAAEGESASGKDKVLLRYVPHLVLDGAVVAAAAIGARKVFLAVGETARTERAAVEEALGERARRRLDGPVQVVVAPIPGGFVSGEETAVINAINGGPPKPTTTPPAPFERGVGRAPTLVQNAETLANVALIARYGAEWFRSQGTSEQPGTVLVTLSGAVAQPGVYEIALGTAIQDLLSQAGGTTAELRALLVGGYFGTWIDADRALPLRLLDADLRAEGASLGARAVVALPDSSCGVCESARAIRYLADESAGQCGPCVFGLGAIAGAFEQIAARERIDPRLDLARWIGEIPGRGACRHPDGAVRFAASALDVFGVEVERHVRHGKCDGDGRPVLPLPTVARQRQRRAA